MRVGQREHLVVELLQQLLRLLQGVLVERLDRKNRQFVHEVQELERPALVIAAEELGVTSANLAEMAKSGNPDVRRLLGVTPGNGKALGLDEAWAYNVVKTVGNYGEVYDRNVGTGSPIKLPRGVNALSSAGGLMFAPPLR